tara:strand:+ start:860 stop:1066 length:207 start_codon:yes stop_codon:yes gene_type:complete
MGVLLSSWCIGPDRMLCFANLTKAAHAGNRYTVARISNLARRSALLQTHSCSPVEQAAQQVARRCLPG